MAHANEELIDRFYTAFGARDGAAMSALYAPNARFSDPVFTDLSGEEPGAMWRMLTGRATDLRIELAERSADEFLSLPMYPELESEQVDRVVSALEDFVAK